MSEDMLSPIEAQQMLDMISNQASTVPDGKHNLFSFFTNIIKAEDTTKVGNLTSDEVGIPKYPIRTLKNASILAPLITDYKELAEVFTEKAEVMTSTSLSKDALLLRLAVTQKKELADVTRAERKENKGWFKKKETGDASG